MINIRFDELSEREIWEAEHREYLLNLKVEADGKTYLINVFGIARLQQEFQMETEVDGYYAPDPNLVIVDEVTQEKIKFTLENIYKQGYFETIAEANDAQKYFMKMKP